MRSVCHLDHCSTMSNWAGSVPCLPDKLSSPYRCREQGIMSVLSGCSLAAMMYSWSERRILTVKLNLCAWGTAINDKPNDRMNKRVLIAGCSVVLKGSVTVDWHTRCLPSLILHIPSWEINGCVLIAFSVLTFIGVAEVALPQNR